MSMNKNEKFVKAPKAKQNPLGPDGVPCGNVNQTGVCKNWRLFYYETCHTCNKKKQMMVAAAAKEAIMPQQSGPAKPLKIKFALDFLALLNRAQVVIEANPADMQTQELAREMKDLVVLIGKRAPMAPLQTNWLMVAQPHDLSPEEVMKMVTDTIKELSRVWANLEAKKLAGMGVSWEICPTDALNGNCKGVNCTGVHMTRTGLFGRIGSLACDSARLGCAEFVAECNGAPGYAPLPDWMTAAWSALRVQLEANIRDQQAAIIKAAAEARSSEEAQASAESARVAAEAAETHRIEMLRDIEAARAYSAYAEYETARVAALERQRLLACAEHEKQLLLAHAASTGGYDGSGNWVPGGAAPRLVVWGGEYAGGEYATGAYSPSPAHFATSGA